MQRYPRDAFKIFQDVLLLKYKRFMWKKNGDLELEIKKMDLNVNILNDPHPHWYGILKMKEDCFVVNMGVMGKFWK